MPTPRVLWHPIYSLTFLHRFHNTTWTKDTMNFLERCRQCDAKIDGTIRKPILHTMMSTVTSTQIFVRTRKGEVDLMSSAHLVLWYAPAVNSQSRFLETGKRTFTLQ